jgi:hypothetical protein
MTDSPLERLARRACADPFFLGSRLAEFARLHRLDDEALAARLGCSPGLLAGVRLCAAPRPDPTGFREDVLCVAGKFGLDAETLAEAAKPGFASLSGGNGPATADVSGVFLAARDREEAS